VFVTLHIVIPAKQEVNLPLQSTINPYCVGGSNFITKPHKIQPGQWLVVYWHINTERSICANCEEGKPAQSAKDGQ